MDTFVLILVGFALLGVLAWQVGADSRDCWNSQEIERSQDWLKRR